jgi:hypothetical protein
MKDKSRLFMLAVVMKCARDARSNEIMAAAVGTPSTNDVVQANHMPMAPSPYAIQPTAATTVAKQ